MTTTKEYNRLLAPFDYRMELWSVNGKPREIRVFRGGVLVKTMPVFHPWEIESAKEYLKTIYD
jgi:hypothetical protein